MCEVIACVVAFLAGMISSTDGLGHLLIRTARSFRMVDLFVPPVTISLLGLALNALFGTARKRLLVGYPPQDYPSGQRAHRFPQRGLLHLAQRVLR
jgi:NitT/TauT family transport system permease protein